MVDLTSVLPWDPKDCSEAEMDETTYAKLVDDVRSQQAKLSKPEKVDPEKFAKYFLHPGKEVMKKTVQNTTRYGSINMRIPMRQHYKSRNPILQRRRLHEPFMKATIVPRFLLALSPNMCLILACALRKMDLMLCLISSDRKVSLLP
jgi:hypothetical protein